MNKPSKGKKLEQNEHGFCKISPHENTKIFSEIIWLKPINQYHQTCENLDMKLCLFVRLCFTRCLKRRISSLPNQTGLMQSTNKTSAKCISFGWCPQWLIRFQQKAPRMTLPRCMRLGP